MLNMHGLSDTVHRVGGRKGGERRTERRDKDGRGGGEKTGRKWIEETGESRLLYFPLLLYILLSFSFLFLNKILPPSLFTYQPLSLL